jgi:gliding motility-associated-like protein
MMKKIKFLVLIIFSIFSLNGFSQPCPPGVTGCPTITMSGSAVLCYGGATGSAAVNVTSGSGQYIYSWSVTGETTSSISGLIAGTYTVNVKDKCTGCTITGTYTVNSPDPISVSATVVPVACFGASTGGVNITVNGGRVPYTYDWSNDGTTDFNDNMNLSGVSSSTYDLVVKDVNGCLKSNQYFVGQPTSAIGLSAVVEDVKCFGGATGTIDISPYGGTTPFAYSWTSGGAITQDVSNLAQGTHSVTIRDNNNCLYVQGILVNEPPLLTGTTFATDVNCFGNGDGEVGINVNGGKTPYTYSWSNSSFIFAQNNSVLTGMFSDIYNVTVTDANDCEIQRTETIGSPSALTITYDTVINVSCYGLSDGEIRTVLNGGTPTYTYEWSNSSGVIGGASNNDLLNVPAGIYVLKITDDNGCILTRNYEVTQPASPLEILLNDLTHVKCYGMNTGAINISPIGGTPGYTYLWSNATNSQDLTSQFEGNYSLVLTDANGCEATENYTIEQPLDTLIATNLITDVICFGEANGGVNLNTTGGTTPYGFEWTNSAFQLSSITEDLVDFVSDTYSVIITDANDCIFTSDYFIPQPDLLTGTTSHVDILCKNDSTGSIDLTMQGGVMNYQYNWSNGPTTEDQMNLPEGFYEVTVTDANFCEFSTNVTLIEPDDTLGFNFESTPVICNGDATGLIDLNATGGSPAYNILWSSNDVTLNIFDLTAGIYSFELTDSHGCLVNDSIEVTEPDVLLANETIEPVTCFGFGDGDIDITPSGGNGGYSFTWFNSDFALSSQEEDLIDFPYDIYQLELKDSLGCLTEVFIELLQPEVLAINAETVNVTCAGGTDGSIDISVMGGNPDYTYLWTHGQTTQDLENVPVDEYTVVVTDTKLCVDSATVVIYEPDSIKMDFEVFEVSCSDQTDGTIEGLPYGGTGEFTFLWSNNDTTALITGLSGGDYTLTVTDIVGCVASDSTFVPTNPKACIDAPTAFTPNGDAYNDTWHLENIELYKDMNIQVFNRWGNLMFQQSGEYVPWDGTKHGNQLPSETYYFIINLNNGTEPFKGTVSIIR